MARDPDVKVFWGLLLFFISFAIFIVLSYMFLSIVPKIPEIYKGFFVIIAILYLIFGLIAPPIIILLKRKFPTLNWYCSIGRYFIGIVFLMASLAIADHGLESGGPTHRVSYLFIPLAKFDIVTLITILFFLWGLMGVFSHFYQIYKWHKKKYFPTLEESYKR